MGANDAGTGAGPLDGHAIIAGFGVPGRAAAESLAARGVRVCVIELNAQTVRRCQLVGVHIIEGDAAEEGVLRSAGIERATLLTLAVPSDAAVLQAVAHARRLNPRCRIIARCRFISTGMEAHRRGADEVVVEEQVVAQEFKRLLEAPGGKGEGEGPALSPRTDVG